VSIDLPKPGTFARSKKKQILCKNAVTQLFQKITKILGQSPIQMMQVIESRVQQEDISDLPHTLQLTEVLKASS
jgi:hypothetical protein